MIEGTSIKNLISASLEGYAIIITLVLLLCYVLSVRYSKNRSNKLTIIMALNILVLLADLRTYLPVYGQKSIYNLAFIASYVLLALEYLSFHGYFIESIENRIKVNKFVIWTPYAVIGIMCVLWILSLRYGFFYSVTADGFVYGKWHILSQLPIAGVIALDVLVALFNMNIIGKRECNIWFLYGIIPTIGIPFENVWNASPIYLLVTITIMVVYYNIGIQKEIELVDKEKELTDSHTLLMMSQIQPHFIFNTLSSIRQISHEPEIKELLLEFSQYLRMNLNTINANSNIPFEKELEHTETYLKIEQLRFGSRLNVEYDLKVMDFMLPPLSLQPIVENAVKHGICEKEEGGTVKISSREVEDSIEITVCDDGAGFDMNNPNMNSGIHVGIENVRYRLEQMINGTLEIESEVGKGTISKIIIPRDIV